MERSIYVYKNGNKIGPYRRMEVVRMLIDNKIAHSDLGWHEGLTEWVAIKTLLDASVVRFDKPEDFEIPADDYHASDTWLRDEKSLHLDEDYEEAFLDDDDDEEEGIEEVEEVEKKNAFYKSFHQCISPKNYFIAVLSMFLVSIPIALAIGMLPEAFQLIVYILYFTAVIVCHFLITLGRLKDMNRSWLYSLMFFFPLLNIALVLMCIFEPTKVSVKMRKHR